MYKHTQPGYLTRYALGGSLLGVLLILSIDLDSFTALPASFAVFFPILLLVLALVFFWNLTIEITDSHLEHYFALKFWRKSYPLDSITEIQKSSSPWYYG